MHRDASPPEGAGGLPSGSAPATARDRAPDAALRRPAPSRHGPVAQLLIAWAPLSLILLAYAAAHWASAPLASASPPAGTNRLGFGLHVAGPAQADQLVFGTVPSAWLQQRLLDGSPHWYDAVAALVYVTHFVSIPLVTAVAWFLLRDRFAAWVAAVLTFTTIGVGVYVVYPAAPPWLASEWGRIDTVQRLSSPGWEYLRLDVVGELIVSGQQGSNPVAAMPSLHAGSTLLIALFLWPVVSARGRAALLGYVAVMGFALVYTGEHYVVDLVAGWLTAAAAVSAGAAIRRRLARRREARSAGRDDTHPPVATVGDPEVALGVQHGRRGA